tara:strand:+ start:236 stop:931 length:696 start_codon:yes stop_codon:yes gene_type:complete
MRGFDVVEPGVFRDPRSGKIYTSVSYRTRQFRAQYPLFGVDFREMPYEGGNGVTQDDPRGRFIKMRCEIRDTDGRLVAVGHAEEDRKFGSVNKTSAIENAETSALGRALANFGFLADQYGEYASADEIERARATERNMKAYEQGDHPAAAIEEARAAAKQKRAEAQANDAPVFSPAFRDLLVKIGSATDGDALKAIKKEIKQIHDDLTPVELEELKTQFLAQSAKAQKGGH